MNYLLDFFEKIYTDPLTSLSAIAGITGITLAALYAFFWRKRRLTLKSLVLSFRCFFAREGFIYATYLFVLLLAQTLFERDTLYIVVVTLMVVSILCIVSAHLMFRRGPELRGQVT